jgi:pyruvate dehydrogenase E1 component alpha subunit
MPRTEIDLPYHVEYLSILDENGTVDEALDPHLPEDLLLKLHRAMLLGRRFDERMLNLQRQGRIGTFAPITGQEAAQIGAAAVLRPTDWLVPCFRETAAELWRGCTMDSILVTNGGHEDGAHIPEDQFTLPVAVPVASQIPHAVGIAWGIKYRKQDHVVMTFFGDGATSEGDFHESMNFASVYQVPLVFVCHNNHWAISVPLSKQTRSRTLAQKALAYDMPGIQVDGNDVLAVYVAVNEAVDRAREKSEPSLVECVTYRMQMHTTADDPKRYRTEEEVEHWRKRDPITRFQKYLTAKGPLSEEKIKALEDEIKDEIQAAVELAEQKMESLTDPLVMFDHVFAELPSNLKEQREELARELAAERQETSHG